MISVFWQLEKNKTHHTHRLAYWNFSYIRTCYLAYWGKKRPQKLFLILFFQSLNMCRSEGRESLGNNNMPGSLAPPKLSAKSKACNVLNLPPLITHWRIPSDNWWWSIIVHYWTFTGSHQRIIQPQEKVKKKKRKRNLYVGHQTYDQIQSTSDWKYPIWSRYWLFHKKSRRSHPKVAKT